MKKAKMNNKVSINSAISLLQIVLLLISIIMIFLPAIGSINDSSNNYSGLNIVFGKEEVITVFFVDVNYTIYEFSIMNLIPYIIMIFGIILLVFSIITRSKGNLLMDGILFLLFAVGGVFLVNVVKFTVPGKDIEEFLSFFGAEFNLSDYFEIAVGAIISAVALFLASLLSLSKVFVLHK